MRLLVIGGSGLVGTHIVGEAKISHQVCFTYKRAVVLGGSQLDLADKEATMRLLDGFRPDWIVHTAGWTWVDGCERDPERAMWENCEQPVWLAAICQERSIRFAYLSTSYVFDGLAGPYDEEASVCPCNVYGRAKAVAEQGILAETCHSALILRTICVWGREGQRKNFVYQALQALREGRRLRLPADQIGNPTWAGDIAYWTVKLMESGKSGIWNLAGETLGYSRVDWFRDIRAGLDASKGAVALDGDGYEVVSTATMGQPALRPLNAGLRTAKIQSAFPRQTRGPSEVDDLILDSRGGAI